MEVPTESLILPFDDQHATIEVVGGKGMSLAKLYRAGLPVPGGFHLATAAYRRFVSDARLQQRITEAVCGCDPSQPANIEIASRRITEFFAAAPIQEDISVAIVAAYADLKECPVAVRSSATAEDLPKASFAGQQDTYLNIQGKDEVLKAIKRCWASLWTARAIGYRLVHGIDQENLALAVVVQELVPADAAGIMFTADPLTGMRDRVTINAAWGLGEAIVGGQVTPDTVEVDKISGKVIVQRVSRKDAMTVRAPGGTHNEVVPAQRRTKAVLGKAQAAGLARIGVQVEELYGQPMDIEWTLARGKFSLVQARPITTLRGHNPAAGEWNDSLVGDFLWTRANYGEAVPDVMTPCTWSLVRILLDNADPSVGPYHYGNIGGRLYANLSEAASLVAAFGLKPKRFAKLIETGFGKLPEGIEIPIVHLSAWRLLRKAAPMLIRDMSRISPNLKRLPVFLAQAPTRCETLKSRIQALSIPAELATLWQTEIAPFLLECCFMVQASANQGGAAVLTIPRRLRKMVGEVDANTLLTGQAPIQSSWPVLGR